MVGPDGTQELLQSALTCLVPITSALIGGGAAWLAQEYRVRKAQAEARIDKLTSAYNKKYFTEEMDKELSRADRLIQQTGLIFIDLDEFKKINDTYGHSAGDLMLQCAADLIRRNLRDYDLFGRWGGDELVALMPETKPQEAMIVAQRIHNDSHKKLVKGQKYIFQKFDERNKTWVPYRTVTLPASLTFSMGLATAPRGIDPDRFLKLADNELYRAKNAGRDCFAAPGLTPKKI